MADVLSAVSIALLLAGKVSRNLPAVCHPLVFASPSTGETYGAKQDCVSLQRKRGCTNSSKGDSNESHS